MPSPGRCCFLTVLPKTGDGMHVSLWKKSDWCSTGFAIVIVIPSVVVIKGFLCTLDCISVLNFCIVCYLVFTFLTRYPSNALTQNFGSSIKADFWVWHWKFPFTLPVNMSGYHDLDILGPLEGNFFKCGTHMPGWTPRWSHQPKVALTRWAN